MACPNTHMQWHAPAHICYGMPQHTHAMVCPNTHMLWHAPTHIHTIFQGCSAMPCTSTALPCSRAALPCHAMHQCCHALPCTSAAMPCHAPGMPPGMPSPAMHRTACGRQGQAGRQAGRHCVECAEPDLPLLLGLCDLPYQLLILSDEDRGVNPREQRLPGQLHHKHLRRGGICVADAAAAT